jgi:hypothetical protein
MDSVSVLVLVQLVNIQMVVEIVKLVMLNVVPVYNQVLV